MNLHPIRTWQESLEWNHPLKHWKPTTRYLWPIRRCYTYGHYRHLRLVGFYRWEALLTTAVQALGIWWEPKSATHHTRKIGQ